VLVICGNNYVKHFVDELLMMLTIHFPKWSYVTAKIML